MGLGYGYENEQAHGPTQVNLMETDKEQSGSSIQQEVGKVAVGLQKEVKVEPRRTQSREEMIAKKAARLNKKAASGQKGDQQSEPEQPSLEKVAQVELPDKAQPVDKQGADETEALVRLKRGVMSGGGVAPPSFSRRRRKARKEKKEQHPKRSKTHQKGRALKRLLNRFLRLDSLWLIPIAAVILIVAWQILEHRPGGRPQATAETEAGATDSRVISPSSASSKSAGGMPSIDFSDASVVEGAREAVEQSPGEQKVGSAPLPRQVEPENNSKGAKSEDSQAAQTDHRSKDSILLKPAGDGDARTELRERCVQWLDERIARAASEEDISTLLADYVVFAKAEAAGRPALLLTAYQLGVEKVGRTKERAASAVVALDPLLTASMEASSQPVEMAAGHYLKGRAYLLAGQVSEAIAEHEAALQASPSFSPALKALYSLYSLRNDPEGVIRAGRLLLAQYPNQPELIFQVAMRLDASGRSKEALELIERGGSEVLKDLKILALQVQAMRKTGVPPGEVLAHFTKHAPPSGTSPKADVLALVLKSSAGVSDGVVEGITDLAQKVDLSALQGNPDLTQTVVALGILAQQHDLPEVSERLLRAVIATDSQYAMQAANDLAYRFATAGIRLDEAEELALRAVRTAPGEEAFLDTLARVYLKKGDPKRALAVFLDRGLTVSNIRHPEARKTFLEAQSMLQGDQPSTMPKDGSSNPQSTP